MNEIIYYKFKKGFWSWIWLLFDIVMLASLFRCVCCCPTIFIHTWQMLTIFIIIAIHLGFWLYKYVAENEMAVITDKDIKIDHNNPIAWKDIAYAEEKTVRCCGEDRKILSLVPRDGVDYKYSWLQLHNAGFTAFSIPLYGIISKADEEKIIKIVDKKVGIKSAKSPKKEGSKTTSSKGSAQNKKTGTKKAPQKNNKKRVEK